MVAMLLHRCSILHIPTRQEQVELWTPNTPVGAVTDVFVAAYHGNFNDEYAASGDMSGKTITVGAMTVNGLTGESGIGGLIDQNVIQRAAVAGGSVDVIGVYSEKSS